MMDLERKHKCNCKQCEYSRKVDEIIETKDVDSLIKLVRELMNSYCNISADLDYANCILDGSWPFAGEILEKALEKYKNHPNRLLEGK